MSGLRSADLPPAGEDDWVRGPIDAPVLLIEYADFECPFCAALSQRLAASSSTDSHRHVFRHFPVRSAHPRAWAAAGAAEAAGRQGRFWEMHDLLFADQGRLDDPHLWDRAERLGLDVERFEADRRAERIAERIRRDFDSGVRAGVVTTPTVFVEGKAVYGDVLRTFIDSLGPA